MKKIFILGASALQVPAIKKAKEKGLYVYVLDYDPEAVGIKEADEFLCISTIDKEAVLEAAKKYKPDYIITSTSDMPVRTVAYVNEKLGKENDISYEDSICATNKAAMRRRMQEENVPIPAFYVVLSPQEFIAKAKILGAKFVSKPADNAASRGVVLFDRDIYLNGLTGDADKDRALEDELKKIYNFTKEYSRGGEVLLEEYMEGPEVSVESFTVDGETHIITITDKLVTEEPFFVETGHTEGSRLPDKVKEDIKNVALAAIKALHLKNGPTHTEIKVTESGAKLVEIAARLGGDFITSRLVPLSTGVDMIECSLSSVLGERVDCEKKYSRGAAIRFLHTPFEDSVESADTDSYVISSIDGVEDAAKLEGVEEAVIYKKVGDEVKALTSSGDRIGHVIATGETADEAEKNAERALETIRIRYELKNKNL